MQEGLIYTGLAAILALIFVLPFVSRLVEEQLEIFLFIMGLLAAGLSRVLGLALLDKALREPIPIALAVLVAGLVFRSLQHHLRGWIRRTSALLSLEVFSFLLVVLLGMLSSAITAIIAALVLVEVVNALGLDRRRTVALDVIACFAIGLGATLTPIGEPLATIAISKLGQDFWYLARLLGAYVIPGIVGLGIIAVVAMRLTRPAPPAQVAATVPDDPVEAWTEGPPEEVPLGSEEGVRHVVTRAAKVYLFVMALVFLGEGFRPLIDRYVLSLGVPVLYWLNSVSAILDNATLTAAEISVRMSDQQVRAILLGLLISGGMLIPGNIPNIISASKLKIGSKEWARLGVPLGLATMVIYFVILLV